MITEIKGSDRTQEASDMYYVYSMHMKTGKEDFIRIFDTSEDAIRHIHRCYSVDSGIGQLGEYYYYMKKR